MDLAGIVTDLVDDELRPAFDFFLEFEVLRDDLVFVEFEVCHHRPGEKIGFVQPPLRLLGWGFDVEPAIRPVQHRESGREDRG